MKRYITWVLIIMIIGLGGLGLYQYYKQKSPSADTPAISAADGRLIAITAATESDGLIPTDAAFEIKTEGSLDEEAIKELLVMEPALPYHLEKKSDSLYALKPDEALPQNILLKFSYKNADRLSGWAFQTVDTFRVKSSYPANESMNVDVHTGVEIDFTQPIDEKVKDYLTIAPAIDFTVKIQGTKAILLPSALEKDVLYVVTLAPGYGVEGEKALENPYQFSFSTGEVNRYYNASTMNIELLTTEMPKRLPMISYQEEDIQLTLYAIDTETAYKDFIDLYLDKARYYKNPGTEFHLETMTPMIDEKVQAITEPEGNYVYLPDDLGKGYYLARLGDNYTFFEVTDYTFYAEASNSQVLLFGINVQTNQVLSKGTVYADGNEIGRFGDDGVCLLKENVQDEYFEVRTPGETVFVPLVHQYEYGWSMFYEAVKDKYQTFFYTDRPTYRSTDTIELYGTVQPRHGEKLKQLTVGLYHGWMDTGAFYSTTVTLSEFNSFTAEIPVEGMDAGYYQIKIYEDDVLIGVKSISIEDYQLPEFQVQQTTDKTVIQNGEAVKVSGQATYFDGTPLKNYELNTSVGMDYYSQSNQGIVTTDTNGDFSWDVNPQVPYDNWRPIHYVLRSGNQNAENMEIGDNSFIYLFPSDISLRATGKIEGIAGHVEVQTHELVVPEDSSNFNDDYKALDGKAVDKSVWVNVKESYYQKTSLGFQYDAIRKIQVESFRYDYIENTVVSQELQTVSGTAQLDFETVKDRYYTAEITTVDSKGGTLKETTYLSPNFIYGEPSNTAYFEEQNESYTLGETIEKSLRIPDSADQSVDKTLFITYQNEYVDHGVTDQPVYKRLFTDAEVPNIVVKAIYYDGYDFNFSQYGNMCYLKLDDHEKQLDVEVLPPQGVQKPGDTIEVGIRTTVKGQPTAAEVVVNVVDEAYYAVFEDYSNIRSELYALKYQTGITATYYPGYFNYYGMAEGGEGDAASAGMPRSIFKDTADFQVIQTDATGQGRLTVKLPDNLTTWRVSALGLTKALEAGQGKGAVKVSLPFFLRTLTSPVYLAEESPEMVLRADGDAVTGTEAVAYTLTLTDPQGVETVVNASGKAFDYTSIALGQLPAGEYRYTVKGTSNGLTDAVAGDFKILPSRVSFDAYQKTTLAEGYALRNPGAKTQLTLWNTDALKYMDRLYSILGTDSDRLEWIIAQAEAQKLLFPGEGEGWQSQNALNLLPQFKDYNGGFKPLVNAEADLLTTVQVVSANSDYLSANTARGYFNNALIQINATRSDQLLALWGLACYNEPVLHPLKSIDADELSGVEKLYYASALAQSGDLESSYEVYSQYALSDASKYDLDEKYLLANLGAYFAGEKSSEEWFALALAEKPLNNARQLEEVKFLKHLQNKLPVAQAVYALNGVENTLILSDHQPQRIMISPEDALEIRSVDGLVTVQENYIGTLENAKALSDGTIQIKRSVSNTSPGLSDIITVKIEVKFPPKTGVNLIDTVPSGFALVDRQYEYGDSKLYFGVWNKNGVATITYRIRAKQSGTFVLEPCVATKDNESFIWTEPIILKVSRDE